MIVHHNSTHTLPPVQGKVHALEKQLDEFREMAESGFELKRALDAAHADLTRVCAQKNEAERQAKIARNVVKKVSKHHYA